MSNESTSLKTPETPYTIASSGNIKEDFQSSKFSSIGFHPWDKMAKATATLLLIGSLNTASFSNSYSPNQQEETSTVLNAPKPIPGRRISMSDARKIALKVLAEAEERRIQFAQEEAERNNELEEE